jgi:hypothetical protein
MLTSIAFSGSPHQLNRRGLVGLFPCVTTGNNKSPQLPPRYILIVFLARGGLNLRTSNQPTLEAPRET